MPERQLITHTRTRASLFTVVVLALLSVTTTADSSTPSGGVIDNPKGGTGNPPLPLPITSVWKLMVEV
ncbi:MAG: hypothetical protein ACSLE6_01535 [Mycobacterium sp.]